MSQEATTLTSPLSQLHDGRGRSLRAGADAGGLLGARGADPASQLMPVLDRLATEYGGRFKLAKVNTDEQQELAQQIGIRSLPTVVLFKDRTAVDHFIGVVPEAQIRQMLDKHLPKQRPTARSSVRRRSRPPATSTARARCSRRRSARDGGDIGVADGARRAESARGRSRRRAGGARASAGRAAESRRACKRLAALLAFSDVIAAQSRRARIARTRRRQSA